MHEETTETGARGAAEGAGGFHLLAQVEAAVRDPLGAVAGVRGGFAVVLAIPIASVVATVIDVAVRDRDPGGETVPTLLFPAKDVE